MPIGDLLASITGEPSPTTTSFPPPKRKADNEIRRPVGISQKIGEAANSSRPITQPSKPPAANPSISRPKIEPVRSAIKNTATSTFKNGQPTPPPMTPAVEPEKAPKKGSFKDTLARAAAAQSRMGQVGKIQHKRIEKMPSRREREAILAQKGKAIQKGLDPKGKFGGTAQAQIRNGKEVVKAIGKVGNGKAPAEPEKKVKKAATATTGYTGTARPKTGAARPAARPGAIASSSRDRFKRSSARRDEYLSEDEEDEEMMEEEEEYSDESDMEAAAFEVDEEEEVAARIAKQEDREALEEENRLKREKLEKKRRLEAMAKKRPGQRF